MPIYPSVVHGCAHAALKLSPEHTAAAAAIDIQQRVIIAQIQRQLVQTCPLRAAASDASASTRPGHWQGTACMQRVSIGGGRNARDGWCKYNEELDGGNQTRNGRGNSLWFTWNLIATRIYLARGFFLRNRLLLWLCRRDLAPAAGGRRLSASFKSPRLRWSSPAPTRMAPAAPTRIMSAGCTPCTRRSARSIVRWW